MLGESLAVRLCPVVIQGLGEQELFGVPFRFANDLQLVAHEQKLVSLADFIHQMCTVHGLADFELAGHQIEQKQYAPAPQPPVMNQGNFFTPTEVDCLGVAVKVFLQGMHFSEASEGAEAVPVPYRYSLSPAKNGKCPVFLPNKLNKTGPEHPMRLGAV